ncbi:hypothetical protein AX16_009822 [Volvariella volvacea WC 439]|nr:hypothetical protein AX16_009822 [Volvariella volvacea WC 439]
MRVSALLTFIGTLALLSAINAYVPPGADTPAFHFVSSSTSGSSNLLFLRDDGTLTSSQAPVILYFKRGYIVGAQPPGGFAEMHTLIDSPQIGLEHAPPPEY